MSMQPLVRGGCGRVPPAPDRRSDQLYGMFAASQILTEDVAIEMGESQHLGAPGGTQHCRKQGRV